MLFLFKKPEVVLDCFTSVSDVYRFAKPDNAIKFIPEWWKKTPSSYVSDGDFHKSPTVKKCDGLISYYKNGVVLPAWSDLAIEIGPKGTPYYRWQYSDKQSTAVSHPFKQLNNCIDETTVMHLKLISPWHFVCKDEILWAWSDPKWNRLEKNDYVALPGTTSFKYQHETNINILMYRSETTKIININFGDPLYHITPITEKNLKLNYHLVSSEEFLRTQGSSIKFTGSFNLVKKLMKR